MNLHSTGGSYAIAEDGALTLVERTKEHHEATGSDDDTVAQAQADQAGGESVPAPAKTQAHPARKH